MLVAYQKLKHTSLMDGVAWVGLGIQNDNKECKSNKLIASCTILWNKTEASYKFYLISDYMILQEQGYSA